MSTLTQKLSDMLNDLERSILEETRGIAALDKERAQRVNILADLETQLAQLREMITKTK